MACLFLTGLSELPTDLRKVSPPGPEQPVDPRLRAMLEQMLRGGGSEEDLRRLARELSDRRPRSPLDELDFKRMARESAGRLKMQMPDINAMARDMVRNLIFQAQPDISIEELEQLVDHYVPDEKRRQAAREQALPRDLLENMIRQFVAYGRGTLPTSEEAELRAAMPDWPQKYWDYFSEPTRRLVRELINEPER